MSEDNKLKDALTTDEYSQADAHRLAAQLGTEEYLRRKEGRRFQETITALEQHANTLQAEVEQYRWVPVTERVPDLYRSRFVLVMAMNGLPYIAWRYCNGIWYDKENVRMQIVTHWMPIPPLPKEEI